MMSSQLGRSLLARRALSADQQDAAPDDAGSYGELMDVIDQILQPHGPSEREPGSDRERPAAGVAFPGGQE